MNKVQHPPLKSSLPHLYVRGGSTAAQPRLGALLSSPASTKLALCDLPTCRQLFRLSLLRARLSAWDYGPSQEHAEQNTTKNPRSC